MGLPAKELTCLRRSGGSNPLVSAHFHFGGSVSPGLVELAPVAQRIEHLTTDQKVGGSNPSGRTTKTPAHRMCGLGFLVFVACWRPISRPPLSHPFPASSNSRTRKPQDAIFSPKCRPWVFEVLNSSSRIRILGFELAHAPPALQHRGWVNVGLCHRFFPFMGVSVGESLRPKCLVIAFLVMVVAFIKG